MKKLYQALKGRTAQAMMAFALTVTGSSAMAQDPATSILPDDFSGQMDAVSTDITTVGAALIGLAVVAVGIKWVKATFFG